MRIYYFSKKFPYCQWFQYILSQLLQHFLLIEHFRIEGVLLVVFLGDIVAIIISNWIYIINPVFENNTDNIFMYVGFLICVICAILQFVLDKQMQKYKQLQNKMRIDTGLWKYSRYPNYFGEVMFWWEIFVMLIRVLPDR